MYQRPSSNYVENILESLGRKYTEITLYISTIQWSRKFNCQQKNDPEGIVTKHYSILRVWSTQNYR